MIDRRFLHEHLEHNLTSILDKRIAILGCGAIGSNLAISLARRGFRQFRLVDNDRIDEHNISTQPWSEQDLGSLKVHTLTNYLLLIAGLSEHAYITGWSKRITSKGQLLSWISSDTNLIVDTFDNSASRQIAQELSRNYPVLHAGMSADKTAEITWAERYTVPPDVELADPCNYPLSRTLVELTVIAASEAILDFLLNGKKADYLVWAGNLSITRR